MRCHFTKSEIRKFLVLYHGLNQLDTYGNGKEGVINYFKRVGSIQMDPISIVGTNPEILLQSRFSAFTPTILDELLYKEYQLVDGFDKEACIFLSSDWGRFEPTRKKQAEQTKNTLTHRGNKKSLNYVVEVLSYVEEHPDTSSKDFSFGTGSSGAWGRETLGNSTLSYLWSQGKIGISSRKNRIKSYSAIDLVIPKKYQAFPFSKHQEFFSWLVLRRLDSLGLYWTKRGSGWLGYFFHDIKEIKKTITSLIKQEKVIEIQIEDMKESFYLTKESYQILLSSLDQELVETVRFIAPLDNFIWDRALIKELFNFEYTWEVYVPEEKRIFGYYVLPILYKDIFIGRLEPSRNKERKHMLEIENIWYEHSSFKNKQMKALIETERKRHNQSFKR